MSRREAVAQGIQDAWTDGFFNPDDLLRMADAAIAAYESYAEPGDGAPLSPWGVWSWWSFKVGLLPGKLPGKEAAAAKRLLDMGLTMDDLDHLWDWMKQDPWYAEKGIDLPMMASAVLKWRAAQATAGEQPRRWDGFR